MMRARRVGLLHGWMWIKQGIWLFRKNPFLWMFLTSILVVGVSGMAMLPVVGGLLPTIVYPAFFAGLMLGCHALAEDKQLELRHLFAGFQQFGTPLLTVGIINMVIQLLIFGAVVLGGGENLLHILMSGKEPAHPQEVEQAVRDAGMMFPIGLALFILVQTSMPYAAMLVAFRRVAPLAAVLAAVRATLVNLLPLLLYSLMVLPFALLATLPYMLGWLVLLPLLITVQYAIYRDMFPMPGDRVLPADAGRPPAGDPPAQT